MKGILFFSILLLSAHLGFSQNPNVKFNYDNNGNRIKRWIDPTKNKSVDTINNLHQDSIANINIVNSSTLNKSISLFPNPTQGLLELKITGLEDGELAEYAFVSLTGQELLRKKTGLVLTKVDISNFAPGTYIVTVSLGQLIETWKIVKQ